MHWDIAKAAQLNKGRSEFPQRCSQTSKEASNIPEKLHRKRNLWHTEYEDTIRSSGTKER